MNAWDGDERVSRVRRVTDLPRGLSIFDIRMRGWTQRSVLEPLATYLKAPESYFKIWKFESDC